MVNKNIQVGLYEKALPPTLQWKEVFELVKRLGFNYVEMSIDESNERLKRLQYSIEECNEIIKYARKYHIQIGSICLSALRLYAIGSENDSIRHKGIQIAYKAIDLSVVLGVRMIQIPGYDVYYETGNDKTRENFLKSLRDICQYASKRGVVLGFETMETEFMDTVKKAMYYVHQVNSPYLQVYPDSGNLSNAMRRYQSSLKEDLRNGDGHIIALHLKETREGYYRNLNYGEGNCDFDTTLYTSYRMGVRRFVLELWYQGESDWYRILEKNCTWMFSKIEENWKNYQKEVT